MGYWRWAGLFMAWLLMAWIPLSPVHAADKARQEDVYDSLQESIEKNWTDGFEHLEATDEIEVKGPLMERILRSIANVFYRHLVGIKGWSLFIGVIIAVTAKLNKKLRRFAITFFVVTVPLLLIIFTFGITKLVSIFI